MGFPALRLASFSASINLFQSLIGFYGFSGKSTLSNKNHNSNRFQSLIGFYGFSGFQQGLAENIKVSIPDRVLWVFRLEVDITPVDFGIVSIPDRVLWVFRP